jgi:hypothetical protein
LSVVKRILEDIGGQIEVHSEPHQGTNITLRLPVEQLKDDGNGLDAQNTALRTAVSSLKGRKVCILTGHAASSETSESQHRKSMDRFVDVLATTLSEVLNLDVRKASVWDGFDDTEVVICPEIAFESLQAIRNSAANAKRICPATIFIAMDVLEAETLRSDARVTSRESIVESITQP